MAKDKEKSINPAAAARKAEKAKALKKGKAAIAQQRTERLAKQNPHRIQTQIDDLKALEANHTINAREKKQLDELERELARVVKAKEAASGEKYIPRTNNQNQQHQQQRNGGNSDSVLGKRARGERHANNRRHFSPESSDTDADVGEIPMPRDTPPPMPRRRYGHGHGQEQGQGQGGEYGQGDTERESHALPEKPGIISGPSQAVYESKPVLRDLRKEATAFVPAAVRKRVAEDGGGNRGGAREGPVNEDATARETGSIQADSVAEQKDDLDEIGRLAEEEERWRREMKQVTIEEVEDEDM